MKIALTIIGFCIGMLLVPFLPFALAAFAWNEYDKGEYGKESLR
jgi:hypothetical protein